MQQHLQRPLPLAGHQGGELKRITVLKHRKIKKGGWAKKKKKKPVEKNARKGAKKNRLFAALKWIPNTAYREMMKIYSYIYRCIYNIYKKILRLLLIHSLAVHRTMRKHCKFICSFFFVNFFFQKFFFLMYKDTFQGLFFCVCVCVYGQSKLTRVKVKNDLDLLRSKRQLTFRPPGFFVFVYMTCIHTVITQGCILLS